MNNIDIWSFQTTLTRRLMVWAAASIIIALPLFFLGEFWRGVGIQSAAWGGIDLLIAIFGMLGTNRRKSRLTPDELSDSAPKESANLKRILLINTALDVLYVTGGVILTLTLGAGDPFWSGNGWGIIIQGAFLFVFDLYHAKQL